MPKVSSERMAATRHQILQGARQAFARHGYEAATVRVLELETGLSRGAIFHHFPDKDAVFLALAAEDAEEMAAVVAEAGLIQAMHGLRGRDAGWLGVQLEVARRLRTDPAFRAAWTKRLATVRRSAIARLDRGQAAGTVRDDVPTEVIATFLTLLHDGLVLHLATGLPDGSLDAVLALAEEAVRRPAPPTGPAGPAPGNGVPMNEDAIRPHQRRRPRA